MYPYQYLNGSISLYLSFEYRKAIATGYFDITYHIWNGSCLIYRYAQAVNQMISRHAPPLYVTRNALPPFFIFYISQLE